MALQTYFATRVVDEKNNLTIYIVNIITKIKNLTKSIVIIFLFTP